MGLLVLRLRENNPPISLAWRRPDDSIITMAQRSEFDQIAAVVGPPGPTGGATRFDVTNSATWIIPHGMGRVPGVQVYLGTGEQVLADVETSSTHVTITFPTATSGFALLI